MSIRLQRIQVSLKPRKEMINTIIELREKGLKTATITNNWRYEHPKNRHFNDNNTYDLFRQKGIFHFNISTTTLSYKEKK
jgi:hypothetical protein